MKTTKKKKDGRLTYLDETGKTPVKCWPISGLWVGRASLAGVWGGVSGGLVWVSWVWGANGCVFHSFVPDENVVSPSILPLSQQRFQFDAKHLKTFSGKCFMPCQMQPK
jgi:hypothetical protein